MTRRSALVLAPPGDPARYLCPACRGHWDYDDVRHVLCCPDCGGGLLRIAAADPPAPAAAGVSALPAT